MQGPIAIAVSADGRILILENINQRIQCFDINGNPSPCFDGDQVTTLSPATYGPDLNAGLATVGLRQELDSAGVTLSSSWIVVDGDSRYAITLDGASLKVTQNGANLSAQWTITDGTDTFDVRNTGEELSVSQRGTDLFDLSVSDQTTLDRGAVDAGIVTAFQDNDITLSPQADVSGNGLLLDPPSYEPDLAQGVISDALREAFLTRDVTLSDKATVTSSVTVTVKQKDHLWIVMDKLTSASYKISVSVDKTSLDVVEYLAYAPLYESGGDVHYLAMATEFRGYIYVLSYTGAGSSPDDYQLDIYQPSGPWLCRTQGVNAANLTIDMWRNMYTLDYASFQGPGGRTEPSISTWIPSTPKEGAR